MKFHGYTTEGLNTGNFSVVGVLVEGVDGQGNPFWVQDQVGFKVEVDHDSIMKLLAIQPTDEFEPYQKMNWLMGKKRSRPWFLETEEGDWRTDPWVNYGPMVYGGQIVAIDKYQEVFGTYREWKRQKMMCGRVITFKREDWKDPINALGMQHATSAELRKHVVEDGNIVHDKDDVYVDRPRGLIYAPIIDPAYGKFKGLGSIQPTEYMIPLDMLIKIAPE